MITLVVEPSERPQFYLYLLVSGIFFALLGALIITLSEWGWSLVLIGAIFCFFSIVEIVRHSRE